MPNLVNEAIQSEYGEHFEGVDALVVQPIGLSVDQVNDLRGRLAASDLQMRLVKGSLARRALEAHGFTDLDALFVGPAALIRANGNVEAPAVAASRVVAAWHKESGASLPEIKGGLMEGRVLSGSEAAQLARLPTKAELQSRLLAQILSPAARLSSQLVAGGRRIAGAIKSHMEKLETSDG